MITVQFLNDGHATYYYCLPLFIVLYLFSSSLRIYLFRVVGAYALKTIYIFRKYKDRIIHYEFNWSTSCQNMQSDEKKCSRERSWPKKCSHSHIHAKYNEAHSLYTFLLDFFKELWDEVNNDCLEYSDYSFLWCRTFICSFFDDKRTFFALLYWLNR